MERDELLSPERRIPTTLRLSTRAWVLLRQLAEAHAIAHGGRPSASAMVQALILDAAERDARPGAES